jgi:long-chain fatty acid transport protein
MTQEDRHMPLRPLAPTTVATAMAIALLNAATVRAEGFAVPELSVAGVGTANALVANPEERGAFIYNPAAMAFHAQSSIAAGTLLINPNFSVKTESGKHDSTGADWIGAPIGQVAIRINQQWSAGLGVSAPFGLETKWETGTFPPLTNTAPLPTPPFAPGSSIPLSPQPTRSKVELVDFTPTATYRVNDNLALSAGADIYWGKSAQLDSSITKLSGDGTGWGFNVSAMYRKDALSLGINFHSAATIKIDGQYTALDNNMVLVGALPPSQTAKLDLNLPWRLTIGARYEVNPKLAVEVDWARTGWSEFQEIKVVGNLNGSTLIDDENNWKDANAYRLGVTYQLLDQTQLRFGYSYDETGQDDAHFSARVPDNDRNLFSIGVSHALDHGWQVEAGYMYVMFEERNYSGVTPYAGSGGDINGTTAIAGKYEAHAHMIGLEVSKTFDAF